MVPFIAGHLSGLQVFMAGGWETAWKMADRSN